MAGMSMSMSAKQRAKYPNGGGQNAKYNEVRHATIVQAIRDGNYQATAAAMAGIHLSTFTDWLRAARAEREAGIAPEDSRHPEYHQLVADIEEAEADFESRMVKKVVDTAQTNAPNTWQAAMTILERKYPEKFGRRDAIKVQGDKENPIQVETRHVLDDESTREIGRDLFRRLTAARAGLPGGVRLGDESTDAGTIEGEGIEVSD